MILSIETATSACSVALHQEGKLLAEANLYKSQSHSKMLKPMIEQVLKVAQCQLSDLKAIAVSKGPGSYTGLRIGTSTAKGLCFALDIPLLSVNTLDALAKQITQTQSEAIYLCPMLDARRMEVYCAIYQSDLKEVQATEAKIIDEHSFEDILVHHKMLFFGDGAEKCRSLLEKNKNAFFIENIYPKANAVGELAYQKYQSNSFEDLAYFEPFYLKDFVNNTKIK
jgi:tRNA threonylcarbamoyladenosine biosynthesis protein TsaB